MRKTNKGDIRMNFSHYIILDFVKPNSLPNQTQQSIWQRPLVDLKRLFKDIRALASQALESPQCTLQ